MDKTIEIEEHYRPHECLWARAIIPMGVGGRTKGKLMMPEDVETRTTEGFDSLAKTCTRNATDGAGAARIVPNELKKAGSAVAYVDFEMLEGSTRVKQVALKISEVPGPGPHTVPRAET